MAYFLNLETSTDVCSVAVFEDDRLICDSALHEPQAHAAKLAPLIKEVLTSAAISLQQLSAVAITSGPGSYTGLRIGTSTAKGICYSLDIPLITIPTLDLMAYQISNNNPKQSLLCPMIDARRMEVYCKVFDHNFRVIQDVEAKVIGSESFEELLATKKMLFFGNGAGKCMSVISDKNAYFEKDIFPSANVLGIMAYAKFQQHEFEDLLNFKPFYLKEFQAKKASPLLG